MRCACAQHASPEQEGNSTVGTACSVILWGHRGAETVHRSMWYEVGFERRSVYEIVPSALFRMVASTATYGIRGGEKPLTVCFLHRSLKTQTVQPLLFKLT